MLKKVNFLICDYCGWKKVSRDIEKIKIHKISEDKYRCPKCGRLVSLRLIDDVQKKLSIEMESIARKEEFEKWTKENFQE